MDSEVPRESERDQEVTKVVQGWVQAVFGLPSANLGVYLLLLSSLLTITSPSENTSCGLPDDKLGSSSRWVCSRHNKTLGTVGSEGKERILFLLYSGKEDISLCSWAEVEIPDSVDC